MGPWPSASYNRPVRIHDLPALVGLASLVCASLIGGVTRAEDAAPTAELVPPIAPRYPPAAPPEERSAPVPMPAPLREAVLRQARRDQKRALGQERDARAAARRDAREGAYDRASESEYRPRLLASLGTAHGMVGTRQALPGYLTRVRQLGFEAGVAYTERFSHVLGVRAGISGAFGPTHMSANEHPGSEGDSPVARRVRASGSLSLDMAPLFFLGRSPFYLSPGVVGRVFFLRQGRTVIDVGDAVLDEHDYAHVAFRRQVYAAGGRFIVGARFGERRAYDFAFGIDAGAAFREAQRYFGLVLRLSVAPLALAAP